MNTKSETTTTRGGKRTGSGRKKKEPTELKTFRIPKVHLPEITYAIKQLIKSFSTPKDDI